MRRSLGNLPNDATGVTRCKHRGGNASSDDTAGADDGARSDRDARHDDGATADPHIGAYLDRFPVFFSSPGGGIEGVQWCVDLDGRPEEGEVTDGHGTDVEHHTVEVEEDALAKANVFAIVTVERRLHPDGVAAGAKQVAQNRAAVVGLILMRRVQRLTQVARTDSSRNQIRIERIVELTRQHLVAFRGHGSREWMASINVST